MSDLFDLVVDTSPANNDVGVPLKSNIVITLSGLDYDSDSLKNGFFVEGPDTDQFVGPGLAAQFFPDNISQGDLNDFLQSPGYKGIVTGSVTVSGISGETVVTFKPQLPLAAKTLYVVNLTNVLDSSDIEIDGFISLSFETGTGSIEVIPSTISSSVLSASIPEAVLSAQEDFEVISTSPIDRAIQQDIALNEIIVTFNKDIKSSSVDSDKIIVKTSPVTDHPSASKQAVGNLAKSVQVVGKQLKIKI